MIIIYGFKECGYCKKSVELCREKGKEFTIYYYPRANYKVEVSKKLKKEIKSAPYIVGIGGFNELKIHLA